MSLTKSPESENNTKVPIPPKREFHMLLVKFAHLLKVRLTIATESSTFKKSGSLAHSDLASNNVPLHQDEITLIKKLNLLTVILPKEYTVNLRVSIEGMRRHER